MGLPEGGVTIKTTCLFLVPTAKSSDHQKISRIITTLALGKLEAFEISDSVNFEKVMFIVEALFLTFISPQNIKVLVQRLPYSV